MFYNAVNILDYIYTADDRMISVFIKWVEFKEERSWSNGSIILEFVSKNEENHREPRSCQPVARPRFEPILSNYKHSLKCVLMNFDG
jgi:hypothetical protein